ncbi:MAG TPA: hypothetical protein VIH58_00895 [Chthoniobacterales bacterium]
MSKATRRAEPWPTIHHGSDFAGRRRGDTFSGKGYVGQVGAFNGLTAQLNEDHRTLRYSNLALWEPRPTKDGLAPPSS